MKKFYILSLILIIFISTSTFVLAEKLVGEKQDEADGLKVNWIHSFKGLERQEFIIEISQLPTATNKNKIRELKDFNFILDETNFNLDTYNLNNLELYLENTKTETITTPNSCETEIEITNNITGETETQIILITDENICGSTQEEKEVIYWEEISNNAYAKENSKIKLKYDKIEIPPYKENSKIRLKLIIYPKFKISNNGLQTIGTLSFENNEIEFWDKTHSSYWNYSWAKEQEILIQENSGTNLTNYIIYLELEKQQEMNSDLSDIRFTNKDKNESLKYWIDSQNETHFSVWVKTLELIENQNNSIFMYFNNSLAQSESNKSDVFNDYNFEDTFSTDTTANYRYVYRSNSNGEISYSSTEPKYATAVVTSWNGVKYASLTEMSYLRYSSARLRTNSPTGSTQLAFIASVDYSDIMRDEVKKNGFEAYYHTTGGLSFYKYFNGSDSQLSQSYALYRNESFLLTDTDWHLFEVFRFGDKLKFYLDNNFIFETTNISFEGLKSDSLIYEMGWGTDSTVGSDADADYLNYISGVSREPTYYLVFPKPKLNITSPMQTVYSTSAILLNISSENTENIWYSINENNYTYVNPTILTLTNGNYELIVYANNSYGNNATSNVSFIVYSDDETITEETPSSPICSFGENINENNCVCPFGMFANSLGYCTYSTPTQEETEEIETIKENNTPKFFQMENLTQIIGIPDDIKTKEGFLRYITSNKGIIAFGLILIAISIFIKDKKKRGKNKKW